MEIQTQFQASFEAGSLNRGEETDRLPGIWLVTPAFQWRMSTKLNRVPIEFEIGIRIECYVFPLGQKKSKHKETKMGLFFLDS